MRVHTASAAASKETMMLRWMVAAMTAALLAATPVTAQEAVVGAPDRAALFHSTDPVIDARKQVVYNIYTKIFEENRYDLVDVYMTKRYIQHNPNIASGREAVKTLFRENRLPKMTIPVFAVVAEGDMVVVASAMVLPRPGGKPGETYTTTHFDMWRFVGNQVDEHWDEARLGPMSIGIVEKPAK
ncbi:nuclear transport factor 2 family protein [Sphingomonas mali]|uniref:nuclear transport factor 2 family protein n=1 Tax=Sphingomonas mali TaxID=40682 RepID=UPI00082E04B2|nr:nuclear transport factor 2 family protein [Sphingomonas mali]